MITDLTPTTDRIRKLLSENTDSSVTYAALECRLAIERIAYDRLRLVYENIEPFRNAAWTPKKILDLVQTHANPAVTETFQVDIAVLGSPPSKWPLSTEEHQRLDYQRLGRQAGIKIRTLTKLWNALSSVALHSKFPQSRIDYISDYGNKLEIINTVKIASEEISRIGSGNLIMVQGIDATIPIVEISCDCGEKFSVRSQFVDDGHILSCPNHKCHWQIEFCKAAQEFRTRCFELICRKCSLATAFPTKGISNARYSDKFDLTCPACGYIHKCVIGIKIT